MCKGQQHTRIETVKLLGVGTRPKSFGVSSLFCWGGRHQLKNSSYLIGTRVSEKGVVLRIRKIIHMSVANDKEPEHAVAGEACNDPGDIFEDQMSGVWSQHILCRTQIGQGERLTSISMRRKRTFVLGKKRYRLRGKRCTPTARSETVLAFFMSTSWKHRRMFSML